MLSALRLPAGRPGLLRPSRGRLVVGVPVAAARSGDAGGQQQPLRRPKRHPPPPADEARPSELGSPEQQQAADGRPNKCDAVSQAPSLRRPEPRAAPVPASETRAASPKWQQQQPPGQPGSRNSPGGRELMRQIQNAETSQQVVRLVQQAGRHCTFRHFSAAVNRVAKLHQQQASASNQAAFAALLEFAEQHPAVLNNVAVVQTVYASGVLQHRLTAQQQAAWQERLVWAFGHRKLEPKHSPNGLWGWSKMGLPLQGQLAPAADAATLRLAASMKPVEVANLLVAYANGGWQLSSLVAAALLQRLEQVLPEAYPQAVANSLWAAAKLGLRLSGSLKTAFVPALPRIIPAATSQAFANILLACGTLGWSPGQRVLAAAVPAMQQRLASEPGIKCQGLNNFLWGLAELQDQGCKLPDSLPALLEAAAGWAGSRCGQLPALDVTDLSFNLARLGHRPGGDWIGSAATRCLECIAANDLEGALFANFIWSCSSWGYRLQRNELEQLVPAAVDRICADWPEPGRGAAVRLVEALTRQEGFRVGPDHPAASAALEGSLLPLVCADMDLVTAGCLRPEDGELPYLASWAYHLGGIGLRLPERQLEEMCTYLGPRLQQLSKGRVKMLRAAFETWGYQPGLALLA